MRATRASEQVVVIGGGQAGLAAACCLTRRAGISPLILDAGEQIGSSWRARWDTLRTFTSARCSSLPGMPIAGPPDRYPSKDEVADYLAAYAARFGLHVRSRTRVAALRVEGGGFSIEIAHGERLFASHVVVATGAFGAPWTPPLAAALPAGVVQLHAGEYRNPAQLPRGRVLVVGAGNSGIQIARELAVDREVVLSCGRPQVEVPQEVLGRDVFWWMRMFGVMDAPVAQPAPDAALGADPVVGNRVSALSAECGIRLVARAVSVRDGHVVSATGEEVDPAAVVWATGYRHDWSWLDPRLRGPDGCPRHEAGVGAVPGSYFVGLYRLRSRGSALLGFVGSDAERLMAHLAADAGARLARSA